MKILNSDSQYVFRIILVENCDLSDLTGIFNLKSLKNQN